MKAMTSVVRMLFVVLLATASSIAWAQAKPDSRIRADVALTFAVERAQIATSDSFWFKGGGADAAVTLRNGLGVAASFMGDHGTLGTSGIDSNKLTWLAGPRYTIALKAPRKMAAANGGAELFGQAMFGGVHGFNGLYPAIGGTTTTANSLAYAFGGGLNLRCARNLKLRLIELDFVHNQLPNAASDTQNNLRIAFGLCFTMRPRH